MLGLSSPRVHPRHRDGDLLPDDMNLPTATPGELRLSASALAAKLRRRHLLLPLILLIHLLLLALLVLSPSRLPLVPVQAVGAPMRTFDVAAPASAQPAPTRPQPEPPEPQETVLPEPVLELDTLMDAAVPLADPGPPSPVFDAQAAQKAGFGTTCDVAATLARAFTENALVRGELVRIGPGSRSVANAIMVWDGQWVDLPGEAPADAVDTLRRAILEGVRAAPPECLAQEIAGPRFIAVNGSRTTILVVGSGTWRWEQLLVEPAASPSIVPQQQ